MNEILLLLPEKLKEQKHLWISILGMPSTGKTTLGQKLSEELGARFVQNPYDYKHSKDFPDTFENFAKEGPLVTEATHQNLFIKCVHMSIPEDPQTVDFLKPFETNFTPIYKPDIVFYLRPAKDEVHDLISMDRESDSAKHGYETLSKKYYESLWETFEKFVNKNPFHYLIKTIDIVSFGKKFRVNKDDFGEEIVKEAMMFLHYHFRKGDFNGLIVPDKIKNYQLDTRGC